MKNLLFLLLIVSIQIHAAENFAQASRGSKNNNPLNIRFSPQNHWLGQEGSDGAFCRFDSAENGFRAAFLLIHRYMTAYGLNTVAQIITRWAPPSENSTSAYTNFVCHRLQCPQNKVVDFFSQDEICDLLAAMAAMESGVEFEMKIIRAAYCTALQSVASR